MLRINCAGLLDLAGALVHAGKLVLAGLLVLAGRMFYRCLFAGFGSTAGPLNLAPA